MDLFARVLTPSCEFGPLSGLAVGSRPERSLPHNAAFAICRGWRGRGESINMNTTAPENPEALKISTSILTAWSDARDAFIALFAQALFALLIS
jgi:hypothetical protein